MNPVIIPIASEKELKAYQNGILNILGKVSVKDCDEEFKEDLKTVYRLLNYFFMNDDAMKDHHLNSVKFKQNENDRS